jgi:nucleoid-associated protein YgaU
MNSFSKLIVSTFSSLCVAALLNGCATANKNMEPVGEKQKSEFIKGMEQVQEQPALEPEWSDWVKEHYPNWREHYWVDRGQWGNRGYVVGMPPAGAEPPVEAQITPLPPAPPAIVDTEPPKIETPEKPTKYVVKKGDSLWRIAGKVYGNPLKWPRIYRANKDQIKNPNRIYPNMVLIIPQD